MQQSAYKAALRGCFGLSCLYKYKAFVLMYKITTKKRNKNINNFNMKKKFNKKTKK